ncbi:MAG: hypothetical protein ACTSPY_11435 [Candidatus Helarchaeota archaeon]
MKRDYFPIIPVLIFTLMILLLGNTIYMGNIVNTQPHFAGTTPLTPGGYLFLNIIEIPVFVAIIYAIYKIRKENKSKS